MKVNIQKKKEVQKTRIGPPFTAKRTSSHEQAHVQLDLAGTYRAEFGRSWARLLWETQDFS